MKYIDAEKLKEEIQPLYEDAKKSAHFALQTGTSSDCAKYDEAKSIYEHILWLIDALQQEQPDKETILRICKLHKAWSIIAPWENVEDFVITNWNSENIV